ncbi:hypothetical protein GCM10010411_88310 [Actinomadura fulvescens]|uniref:Uncharacterized protein n=1 Tax=Actinomadura fulvescens TaxID=46160 RepID=A0ABP6D503_9ACTN
MDVNRSSVSRALLMSAVAGMVAMGGLGSIPVAQILALVNRLGGMAN